jgi:hypothetical protein
MPLLSAAALQLAHAALGCVRRINVDTGVCLPDEVPVLREESLVHSQSCDTPTVMHPTPTQQMCQLEVACCNAA